MNTHRSVRGPRDRWRLPTSPWLRTLLGVGAVALLLGLTLVGLRLGRPGVLPGVEVAGHEVGGLDRDELTAEVAQLVEDRQARTITVVLDADDTAEVTSPRADLGYSPDVAATVDGAWRRGRQLNPVAALADHARAFRGTTSVPLAEAADEEALEAWVARVATELDRAPFEGEITIAGDQVDVRMPAVGAEVDRPALLADAHEAVLARGEQHIVAASDTFEPETDPDEVDTVAEQARRAVSAGVRLHREAAALELTGSEIGDLLSVERTEDGTSLELVADAEALTVDEELIAALEVDPEDARFEVGGDGVELIPGVEGFRFDPEIAAEQVVEVASADGDREAELDGDITEPELTTEEAEDLEITELVSTFTTNHACCQSRVQNIQRMADIVSGVVLRPGEEFSINEHVGPRTREGGFTEGGIILRGEFVDAVGGGVSQFATTFFNAAYEGGYEILQHQPHSYYISRYPEGREATLNYPNLDVRIRNDSPYGLLLHTRYTGTSITVDFYGKEWVDVETVTSPRRNHRPPPEEFEENDDLEPGEERVVQGGRAGFAVTYTRRRTFPDGTSDEESWSHTYVPEPRIVERNTSEPEDDDDDEDEDDDEDDDNGGGDD